MKHTRPSPPGALLLALVTLLLGACGGEPDDALPTVFGDGRPVALEVPASYDPNVPAPLLIGLHGLGGSAITFEARFGFRELAEREGMLYLVPNGTENARGRRFWNATRLCCDFEDTGVDDSTYLLGLIEAVDVFYAVDPDRVYLVGLSNGHFMAYRFACDHADRVAAIAGYAGGSFADASDCAATEPVHVLHVHGTEDQVVSYDPYATVTTGFWSQRNGCGPASRRADRDLTTLAGAETRTTAWQGCDRNGALELWSVEGAGHVPDIQPSYSEEVLDWLLAHPRR